MVVINSIGTLRNRVRVCAYYILARFSLKQIKVSYQYLPEISQQN